MMNEPLWKFPSALEQMLLGFPEKSKKIILFFQSILVLMNSKTMVAFSFYFLKSQI